MDLSEVLRLVPGSIIELHKPADAERYKVETLANARRFQLEMEAAGEAAAKKAPREGYRAAKSEM
jgi:flotillin